MKNFFRAFKERELNLLAIIFFCISMGIGFFIEFWEKQTPCILCLIQRIIMIGIAFSLYLNIVFGVRVRYYGFALIWSLLGLACSLRHIAINLCKEVPVGAYLFGPYRVYTWSFLIFFFSIFGIALLLCLNRKPQKGSLLAKKDAIVYVAASLLLVMLLIGLFAIIQKHGFWF